MSEVSNIGPVTEHAEQKIAVAAGHLDALIKVIAPRLPVDHPLMRIHGAIAEATAEGGFNLIGTRKSS